VHKVSTLIIGLIKVRSETVTGMEMEYATQRISLWRLARLRMHGVHGKDARSMEWRTILEPGAYVGMCVHVQSIRVGKCFQLAFYGADESAR
jgi:hypothetical protein